MGNISEKAFFYILKYLGEPYNLILGAPWFKRNLIILEAAKVRIFIGIY
jgi:hypothetical protein